MDCRWTFCVLAALLSGAAGCEHFSLWPSQDPKVLLPPDDKEKEARVVWQKQTKLLPETLVTHADLMLSQALSPTATPAEKEHLLDLARDDYMKCLKEYPKFAAAHLGMAHLHECMGHHDKAVASYQQYLALQPQEKEVWFELAKLQAQHKEFEPAIASARKAVELSPENRGYLEFLGLTLARAGRYEESFGYLRPLLGEADAHCMIGRMLHHLHQDDAARQHVELALQVDPNLKAAQNLRAELNGQAPAMVGAAGAE